MWPSQSYTENWVDYRVSKNMPLESLNRIIISHRRSSLLFRSTAQSDARGSFTGWKVFSLLQFIPPAFVKSLCGLDVAADDNLHGASFRSFESGKIYCGNTRAPNDNLFKTVMVILRQIYVSSRNESVLARCCIR